MKRSLTGILIVVVLTAAGLLLALAIGSRPTPAAFGSPLSPIESPLSPRPTPRPTPRPMPAPWPGEFVWVGPVEELTILQNASSRFAVLPRIVAPNTDGKTLVGIIHGDTDIVVAIDLASGTLRVLADRVGYPDEPRVSGSNVVWATFYSLYLYNLDSEKMVQENFDIVRYARISGSVVIWEQDGGDIRGLDLKSKENFPVATRLDVYEMQPEFSREWVVFSIPSAASYFSELWATNIHTQETIRLGDFPVYELDDSTRKKYAIDAPWVVWAAEGELRFYNLEARDSFTVTVEPCIYPATEPGLSSGKRRPDDLAISGSIVIADGCGERVGYDIARGVFFSIPVYRPDLPEGWFDGWTISGGRLVWVLTEDVSGELEQSHIFTARIEHSP